MGDAVQPIAYQLPAAKGRRPADEHEEGGLERIFGVVDVAQDAPADAQHHRAGTPHQGLEGGIVPAGQEGPKELGIGEAFSLGGDVAPSVQVVMTETKRVGQMYCVPAMHHPVTLRDDERVRYGIAIDQIPTSIQSSAFTPKGMAEQLTMLVLAILWADEHLTLRENVLKNTSDCFLTPQQYKTYPATVEYVFAYAVYRLVRA